MEEYNNHHHQLSENASSRGSGFPYAGPVLAPSSSVYGRTSSGSSNHHGQLPMNSFHSSGDCYDQSEGQHQQQHPVVKTEAGSSQNHNSPRFYYYQNVQDHHHHHSHDHRRQESDQAPGEVDAIKAKIIAHPQYSNLLEAYMDCQKVGAPPEVVARLAAVRQEFEARQRAAAASRDDSKDPELDQFMEAYCDMLVKYREELTRPLQEAMEFMRRIETQLNMLTSDPVRIFNSEKCEGVGSSEDDQDNSGGETALPEIDPRAEDRELKNHLLKKYSGYLSSLKQELQEKEEREAAQRCPSETTQLVGITLQVALSIELQESEKVALAESTGLDQKQINNWFINQRKRHWKPSEDMQFMVMDGLHPQSAALYMEGHYMGEGPYRLGP
ncbi:UNVERIFIED_CONTAM: Homeobox protein knotted-1-like 2 [Sesamum latifolium]|uniref:Homeobox protein knotted-1-like 2 n=1 Tax=Sesamum latifolium TaxID=2727402 RepID=A0AAW2VWR6_9LAMI